MLSYEAPNAPGHLADAPVPMTVGGRAGARPDCEQVFDTGWIDEEEFSEVPCKRCERLNGLVYTVPLRLIPLDRLGAEGRHWKVGGIFVSHRVSGFLDTPYDASVLDNVASTLYLRQKDTEAKRVAQRLELSPAETKFLQQATISDKYRGALSATGPSARKSRLAAPSTS